MKLPPAFLEFIRPTTFVEWMIIAVIIALLCAMAVPAFVHVSQDEHALFDAWRKMEHRSDVTFEEWETLRRAGLIGKSSSK